MPPLVHPALVAVATAALGADGPVGSPSAPDGATMARLLGRIRATQGPEGLLRAGEHLDVVGHEPLVLVLLNSEEPAVLLDKIGRLNRYFHSSHRQRIVESGDRHLVLDHHALGGPAPTADESLFVCGLHLALLERIGCRSVRCRFPRTPGDPTTIPTTGVDRWRFDWDAHRPGRSLPGLDRTLLEHPLVDLEESTITARAGAVVAADVGRAWRVDELAAALAVSPRTLQRRLRAEGTTFSSLLTGLRIDEARRLLAGTAPIGDIGYATGFVDTAHFSRTFKQATGTSPSGWRARRRGQ